MVQFKVMPASLGNIIWIIEPPIVAAWARVTLKRYYLPKDKQKGEEIIKTTAEAAEITSQYLCFLL